MTQLLILDIEQVGEYLRGYVVHILAEGQRTGDGRRS